MHAPAFQASALPAPEPQLEEAGAAAPADAAPALAFALWRAAGRAGETRPVGVAAPRRWLRERGRLFGKGAAGLGIDPGRLLLIAVEREAQALWAMEEALKSGAVAGVVGTVATAPFVATRRLDFAAKAGRAACLLLRTDAAQDLSAARLRWRIGAAPSASHPFDPRAPGAARLRAHLVRRRNGPLGQWMLEQDDEAPGFRLAGGLADHGVVARPRPHAA